MARKNRNRGPKYDGLGFITDKTLRADMKISLGFSSYLIRNSAKATNQYNRRELHRVVILYVASVVEALCLFLLRQKGLSKEKIDYKCARAIKLPDGVVMPSGKVLVIALQEKTFLSLSDVPFVDAINTLQNEGVIVNAFAKKLHALRVKRNSQHLYGRTSSRISTTDVNRAFLVLQNLFKTIQKI